MYDMPVKHDTSIIYFTAIGNIVIMINTCKHYILYDIPLLYA